MADRVDAARVVQTVVDDHVAVVTLNRPEKLNALNEEMRHALDETFAGIGADVRVVVLTGSGRAFCAGADLSGGGPRTSSDVARGFTATSRRQLACWNLPQPVIAAVNGHCLGRGMELALWCDLVVAGRSARFGEPEVRDGSFVASILPWLVNPQVAKYLMLTGDTIDAQEARRHGFVTTVADDDDALPTALRLAKRLAHVPPPTAQAVKRYVNAAVDGLTLAGSQEYGNAVGAALRGLTSDELGTTELLRVRDEQGLKAYLAARDAPFSLEGR